MTPQRQQLLFASLALTLAGLGACGKVLELTEARLPASSATSTVSDIDVTEHVKAAWLRADSLEGMDIGVVTTKGDVRRSGVLDRQAQVDDALRIARATEGAHTIHDELTRRK